MLELKGINTDAEKEWEFVRNMPEDENGLTNSYHGISKEDFISTVLPKMAKYEKGEDMPDWMVPETILYLWQDEKIVGQFRIRQYLNEALRTGAGHIGYFIAKEYRGKGFATEGLRQTLEVARRIVPEDEIYLRVNEDNPASLKVMTNNGEKHELCSVMQTLGMVCATILKLNMGRYAFLKSLLWGNPGRI